MLRKSSSKLFLCLFLLFFTVFLLLPPERACACACCSDEGEWFEHTSELTADEIKEMARLRYSRYANLFVSDAGGFDIIEGISPVTTVRYFLTQSQTERRWKFELKDTRGKSGALLLAIPENAVSFGTDPFDGRRGGGGGPLLYKEWRFNGKVEQGTGIFLKGISADTQYRLILKGRGNNCTNVEDYKYWTLEVKGTGASYSFYGPMNKAAQ